MPSPRSDAPDLAALLLAAAGAMAIGFVPFVTVELFRGGFDTPSVMFWRALFALVAVTTLAIVARTPLRAAWLDGGWRMTLLSLTVGTFQSYAYFRAVERFPTSLCVVVFFVFPLVTIVLQRLFHGVRATLLGVGASVLILVGAALSGSGTFSVDGARPIDFFFLLVPPLTYGAYAVFVARFVQGVSAFAGGSFIQLGLVSGFAVVTALGGLVVPATAGDWALLVAVGVFGSAFHVLTLAYSMPRLGATGYAVVSSLELVTVVMLGIALLGERLTAWQWLGVAFVLAGVLIYRPAKPR